MLNKKDFLGMIAVRFLKRFNDICTVDISKENSFRLKLDSGRSTFINCNFDSIYSDYVKGISIDYIFNKLLRCINAEKLGNRFQDIIGDTVDKNNILKSVVLYPANKENVKGNSIYNEYGMYSITRGNITFLPKLYNNASSQIPITKDMCDKLGISREELLIAAVENTENAEYHIVEFKDILENIGIPCPDIPMYAVVSNSIKTPALFASGKALNDIANRIQDDYWILPSSTEEFFILPKEQMNIKDRNDLLNLANIIKKANIEGAARKEGIFLSDELYQYDRNKGLSIAL